MSSISEFQFNSGLVTLSGLDFGNADAPDMLVLHGMRDFAWSMKPIAEAFCDRYHVVVPDLRGHGDSDNPGIYSMSHFIADLRGLVVARQLPMRHCRLVLKEHSEHRATISPADRLGGLKRISTWSS